MESIKVINRLAVAYNERANIVALRFANRTANGTAEAVGQFLNAGPQIERMPVEFRCGRIGGLKRFCAAGFQGVSAGFLCERHVLIFFRKGEVLYKNCLLSDVC